jgi:hypothetical protein
MVYSMSPIENTNTIDFKIGPHYKVWVYIADRPLQIEEQHQFVKEGNKFLATWHAHGADIKGEIKILINQVIVVSADQSHHENSGCSIDKLLHFIQGAEQQMQIQLLNRMLVPVGINDTWTVFELKHLKTAALNLEHAKIMNVMVNDSESFNTSFIQDLKRTWVANHLA